MKKAHTLDIAGQLNSKVLGALGAKKEEVGKTIFKLSPEWDSIMRTFAKAAKMTLRDFLDSLASIAEHTHAEGTLPDFSPSQDGVRMSYAISKKAKDTFTRISRERNISRDCLVQSVLLYMVNEFKKNSLTDQEKINYANILLNARKAILEIYYSDEVYEAIERIRATGDPDFSECDEKIGYIEQLNELDNDIKIFIQKKENNIKI